jgi:hypothetical protein
VLYLGGRKRGGMNTRKKIYVSIPSLGYDPELIPTIESCLKHSTNIINISIAFIGNYGVYENIKSLYPQVNSKYYSIENLGVGNARLLAASSYNNEDYFLQIDSHSLFFEDWDNILIEQYNEALKISPRVVLSGYPPRYERFHSRLHISGELNYPIFLPGEYIYHSIPKWGDVPSSQLNIDGMHPLNKISANFLFGDKQLAQNLGVDKDIIFWEEELIQSINLIDNKFTLIYPGKIGVFAHRYREKSNPKRSDIFSYDPLAIQKILHNYYKFILNPQNEPKIDNYQ